MHNQLIQFSFARVFVFGSAVLALSTIGGAQTVQRIDASQPSCKGCTLTFTKIATVGSVNDPEFAGTAATSSGLAVDSKGRTFATELGATRILVYQSNGKFMQSFGQKGKRPRRVSTSIENLNRRW